MDRANWVVKVLDDSHNKSIEYKNRNWLLQNVEKLNINVCVEDCEANVFKIAEYWKDEATILIQEGEPVKSKADFHPGKEALLIGKPKELFDGYLVYVYYPKE